MKKHSRLLASAFLFFGPGLAAASSLRVDSTGGLSLVLTDETCDINPYTLGNPAGMALLPPATRLDLDFPFYSATTGGPGHWTNYGLSPGLNPGFMDFPNTLGPINPTAGFAYQGLLYVPKEDWAYQAGGGLWDTSAQPTGTPWATDNRTGFGLIRAAYKLGNLAGGTEFQMTDFSATTPASSPITFDQSSGVWNTGVVASIPLGGEKDPAWLGPGASFSFTVLPEQSNNYFSAAVTQRWDQIQNTSRWVFEPSLFLEVPGSFQGGIVLDVNHDSTAQSFVLNNVVSQPQYHNATGDGLNFAALYKWKPALSAPGEPHPLTLNNGVACVVTHFSASNFNPAGATVEAYQDDGVNLQVGLGLEREGDFTVGIQSVGFGLAGNAQYPFTGTSFQFYDFATSRVTLGGEKWLSPHWTLRLGLAWVDDRNTEPMGGNLANEGFFLVAPGEEIQGLMTTAGAGYQDSRLRLDGIVWFESPQSTGAGYTGSGYAYTVLGAGLSGTLFFGQ